MLRRAPTSISLSMRDVEEHLEHIKQEKAKSLENNPPRRQQPSSLSFTTGFIDLRPERHYHYEHSKIGPRCSPGFSDILNFASVGVSSGDGQKKIVSEDGLALGAVSPEQLPTVLEYDEARMASYAYCDDEDRFISLRSPSSMLVEKPLKLGDEVYSESPCVDPSQAFDHEKNGDIDVEYCSSFTPQDISSPHNIELKDYQRLHGRIPFPGSSLVASHRMDLPKNRPTSSLTPYVASCDTPSVLLSQPAQRLMSYRPRTLSYSFEESERASAAYEEAQRSDNDSIDSGSGHVEQKNLQEELEDDSSHSLSADGNLPSSPASVASYRNDVSTRSSQAKHISQERKIFYFSSPQLSLPPPFSAVRRNVSSAAALPSSSQSPSATPPHSGARGLQSSPTIGSLKKGQVEHCAPELDNAVRNLATLPYRLLELYQSRSPLQSGKESTGQESASSISGIRSNEQTQVLLEPSLPLTQFHIYDDRLPASVQPQTPEHLPESRHRSRLHPSYTSHIDNQTDSARLRQFMNDRRRGARSDSPAGMDTPGFSGLYGGQENEDDEVMFDRAAQRLFSASLVRRRRRGSMDSTPERE